MTGLRELPPGYVTRADGTAHRPNEPFPKPQESPRDHLAALMACPSFRGRLSPEDEVSYWCAAELRRLTRARLLRCVWTMVPGEQRQGGRLGPMHQARVQALGYVPGCSDFLFLWKDGSGGIEIKTDAAQALLVIADERLAVRKGRRTYQRPRQRDFERWCLDQGVHYGLARRWRDMQEILRLWGRI